MSRGIVFKAPVRAENPKRTSGKYKLTLYCSMENEIHRDDDFPAIYEGVNMTHTRDQAKGDGWKVEMFGFSICPFCNGKGDFDELMERMGK